MSLRPEDGRALARWKAERVRVLKLSRQYELFRNNALAYGQNDLAKSYGSKASFYSDIASQLRNQIDFLPLA